MNAYTYYRAREIRLMRKQMQYTQKDYLEDWMTAQAVAQIMAERGEEEHLKVILESCMNRVIAYSEIAEGIPKEEA